MKGCDCAVPLTVLTIATENAELRLQLAEAQDQCVELAVDAGELHAEIETLRGPCRKPYRRP